MGSQVIAKCECGLETSIMIGGGMADFGTKCYFPCFCEHCHSVVQVNLLAKRRLCPKCKSSKVIPYDDPRLSESKGTNSVASWNMEIEFGKEMELTDGNYKCPKCGQMTLRFTDSGLCWD